MAQIAGKYVAEKEENTKEYLAALGKYLMFALLEK